MKIFLLTCAATASLLLMVPAASAGDLGLAGASYDWSGGYVGVNAGAGINNSSFRTRYTYTGTGTIDETIGGALADMGSSSNSNEVAFTGGAVAGYNMQYSNFVLGAETDFNYLALNGSTKHDISKEAGTILGGTGTGSDKISYTEDWYGTFRARAGYAIDNILLYGTAGVAYGQIGIKQKVQASNDAGSVTWDSNANGWKAGWTAGAGIEYGTDQWTLGLEYLYVDLNDFGWNANSVTSDVPDVDNVKLKGKADYQFNVVRATAKYRF